jgi:hypothetical protein
LSTDSVIARRTAALHLLFLPQAEGIDGEGATIEADTPLVGQKANTRVARVTTPMNPIFALVERNGRARYFYLANAQALTLRLAIDEDPSNRDKRRNCQNG